jgi:hypothetical protein
MLVQALTQDYEYKQSYEDLKKAGFENAEAILAAWAEGNKEGKAKDWNKYLD